MVRRLLANVLTLWSVLIRGRFNPVAFTGDTKKAFSRVRI